MNAATVPVFLLLEPIRPLEEAKAWVVEDALQQV
jgi:hypothetical protein